MKSACPTCSKLENPGSYPQYHVELGMVAHMCDSTIQEVEPGGLEGQSYPQLHINFQAHVGYVKPCLRTEQTNKQTHAPHHVICCVLTDTCAPTEFISTN